MPSKKTAKAATPAAAPASAAQDQEWRAQEDMHTLARAAEVRADPKRLKAAQELAKKKLMELAKVAGGDSDD